MSLWQREKDSNPHIRSQSPLCYLYTIPLCPDEQKLLYRFHGVCQQFFSENQQNQKFIRTPEFDGIYERLDRLWRAARCAAAKKENACGKTGAFGIIWRFGCFGRWHTRRTGRGREAAPSAMRILYMYRACLLTAPIINAPYHGRRII